MAGMVLKSRCLWLTISVSSWVVYKISASSLKNDTQTEPQGWRAMTVSQWSDPLTRIVCVWTLNQEPCKCKLHHFYSADVIPVILSRARETLFYRDKIHTSAHKTYKHTSLLRTECCGSFAWEGSVICAGWVYTFFLFPTCPYFFSRVFPPNFGFSQ